jgi:hypothetical protein
MYCRTEIRFYQEILPDLLLASSSSSSSLFSNATPHIFYAKYDLEGILTEDERTTDPSGTSPVDVNWTTTTSADAEVTADNQEYSLKGGFLVMEGISHDTYFQDSPITIDQAKQTLAAVASLHAAAWQDQVLLTKAEERLSRGSYHLKTRNPKELAGMEDVWISFVNKFRDLDSSGVLGKCGEDLGRRVQRLAEYICEKTSPGPTDPYATLSHGDFKAMNCFLPRSRGSEGEPKPKHERGVVMVDFASVGVGLGMQDVAMHIHHAVRPSDLKNGGEMMLVDFYLTVLNDLLRQKQHQQNGEGNDPYPRDVALRHYQLAVVDYFRFFLGRFWKSATPETMIQKKNSKNTALINRDVEAAFAFLDRVQEYVSQIEANRKKENDDACINSNITFA